MSQTQSSSESDAIEAYWRLGGVPVDFHAGPEPTITPSESYDFKAVTTTASDPPAGEWGDAEARHATLLRYGARAGQYDLHDYGGTGVYGYTETHDGDVPNGSLLVSVRPPAGSLAISRGGWYLVESVTDAATKPLLYVTLSLTYLAPLAREDTDPGYRSRIALAHDLEADPL